MDQAIRQLHKPKLQAGPWRETVTHLPDAPFEFFLINVEVQYGTPYGPEHYHWAQWNSNDYWTADVADALHSHTLLQNLALRRRLLEVRRSGETIAPCDMSAWMDSECLESARATPLSLPPIDKYARGECIVKAWGIDPLGRSVCMRLTNWRPWIVVELPDVPVSKAYLARLRATAPDAAQAVLHNEGPWDDVFHEWIDNQLGTHAPPARREFLSRIHWDYYLAQNFYGYVPDPDNPLQPARSLAVNLYAPNHATLRKLTEWIRSVGGRVHHADHAGTVIPHDQQLQHQLGIHPQRWIAVQEWREPSVFLTHAQIELECPWQSVSFASKSHGIPLSTVMSFDIECCGDAQDSFPDPSQDECAVTTIGITLTRKGILNHRAINPTHPLVSLERAEVSQLENESSLYSTAFAPPVTRQSEEAEWNGGCARLLPNPFAAGRPPALLSASATEQMRDHSMTRQLEHVMLAPEWYNGFYALAPSDQVWFQTHHHSLAELYAPYVSKRTLDIMEWAHRTHAYDPTSTGEAYSNVTKGKLVDAPNTRRIAFEYCPDLPAGLDFLRLRIPTPYRDGEGTDGIFTICCRTEALLLQSFVRLCRAVQPDVITAHNSSFDYGYLYARAARIFGERGVPFQIDRSSNDTDEANEFIRAANETGRMASRISTHQPLGALTEALQGGEHRNDYGDEPYDPWEEADTEFVDELHAINIIVQSAARSNSHGPQVPEATNDARPLDEETPPLDRTSRTFLDAANIPYEHTDFFWLGKDLFDTTPAVMTRTHTSANGARALIYPPMPGVMDLDSYIQIMNDVTQKHGSYTLSFLSKHLLDDDKIDLPPAAINARFRGGQTRGLPSLAKDNASLANALVSWIAIGDPLWQTLYELTRPTTDPSPVHAHAHVQASAPAHAPSSSAHTHPSPGHAPPPPSHPSAPPCDPATTPAEPHSNAETPLVGPTVDLRRLSRDQRCDILIRTLDLLVAYRSSATDGNVSALALNANASLALERLAFAWPWNALDFDTAPATATTTTTTTTTSSDARSAPNTIRFILHRSYYDITAYCLHDVDCCSGIVAQRNIIQQKLDLGLVTKSPACIALRRGVQYMLFPMITHEAYRRGIIFKRPIDLESGPYQGAYVINPVPGLYDDTPVPTQDFAAMFPSIMQSNNLCFTTIFRPIPVARCPQSSTVDAVTGTLVPLRSGTPYSTTSEARAAGDCIGGGGGGGNSNSNDDEDDDSMRTVYITPTVDDLQQLYGPPTYPPDCHTPRLRRLYDLLKPRSSGYTAVFVTDPKSPPIHVMQYDARTGLGYRGILPALIDNLKAERARTRSEMKAIQANPALWDAEEQRWLDFAAEANYSQGDGMQNTFKIGQNSLYGGNGTRGAIACIHVASITTRCARVQLEYTREECECRYNHGEMHEERMIAHGLPTTLPTIHRGSCVFDSDFKYSADDHTSPPPYRFLWCQDCLYNPNCTAHESQLSPVQWETYKSMVQKTLPPP